MLRGALHIESLRGAVRCTWSPPSGEPLSRIRNVHPDDLNAARSALDSPPASLAELEDIGSRIFSRLLDREVRNAVFSAARCALLISTDCPGVPWELACCSGQFLADVHALGRAPACETLPTGSSIRVLMVADPTGDLPYSLGEARFIEDRLRTVAEVHLEVLTGVSATRDAVLGALESTPCDAVHFSCHAVYNRSEPARSHVLLFDGPLTAEDIYQTNLEHPPSLCVLNACESGLAGCGSPAEGLASAFRSAGAGAVIGAQWPVDNKSATHWMASFYSSLAAGECLGQAAGLARVETRRLFSRDPLLTWAAFTLNGAPWTSLISSADRKRQSRTPLTNREKEMQCLDEAWQDCKGGRGGLVLLTGPSDSGKSRLLDDWLAALPASVVQRCECAVGSLPGFGSQPGVLAIDDVEAGEQEMRAVLNRLQGLCESAPVLAVVCARGVPSDFVGLARSRLIVMKPLDAVQMRAMFQALGAEQPSSLVLAYPGEVERAAQGLPLRRNAVTLASSLPEPERRTLRGAAVWGDLVPVETLGRLLETEPARLSPPLETLCAADWLIETSPGVFTFRDTSDREAVLTAFAPAYERAAMERRVSELCVADGVPGSAGYHLERAGDIDGAAVLYQEALKIADTPAGVIRWTEALTTLGRTPSEPAVPAQAYADTGDWLNARLWWTRAVEATENRGFFLLQLAKACLKTGDVSRAETCLDEAEGIAEDEELDVARAEMFLHTRRPDEALERAQLALGEARVNGNHTLAGRAALLAANAALMLADAPTALSVCRVGLSSTIEPPMRTGLTRATAQALQYSGDYPEAERILLELLQSQRDEQRRLDCSSTLMALAQLWRDQGRLQDAMAALDETDTLAQMAGESAVISETESIRSSVLRRLGRLEDALYCAENAAETAANAGLGPEAIRARIHIATALAERGALAAALEHAHIACKEAGDIGYRFGEAWARTVEGLAGIEALDTARAQRCLNEAFAISTSIHGHIGMASATHYLGWLAWVSGIPAFDFFERSERYAARISYSAIQLASAFGMAMCNDDFDGAAAPLSAIEALNMGGVVPWLREKRGTRLYALGRYQEALNDLAPAYRVARRSGMRMLQARCAASLACVYDALGDPSADTLREEGDALRTECLSGC